MVEYHPTSRDQSRLHQVGRKIFHEMFIGHASIAGNLFGTEIFLVEDIEESILEGSMQKKC